MAPAGKVQKVMVQPVNVIFRCLQIWLYEDVNNRVEGYIIGFDEYMNIVLDEAEEVHVTTPGRKKLGRILLKGGTISLVQTVQAVEEGAEERDA